MKTRFIVPGIVLIFAIFTGLNWGLIVTPSTVNLFGYKTDAPLGLVMLSVLGLAVLMFFITILRLKYSARKKERMLTGELESMKGTTETTSDKNINEKSKKSIEMDEGLTSS